MKNDEGKIPSQADIFRSVAEQSSITKTKDGTPLSAIIYYVQRTAVLNKVPFCAVSEETPNVAGLSYIQADIEDSPVVCVTDMDLMHMNAITLSAVISVVTSV